MNVNYMLLILCCLMSLIVVIIIFVREIVFSIYTYIYIHVVREIKRMAERDGGNLNHIGYNKNGYKVAV